MTQSAADLHRHVPPDWYFQSIRKNVFQRFWHTRRFENVSRVIQPADRMLDIGCADGVFSKVILEKANARELIGVDVLQQSIDWANDHWKQEHRMKFQTGDAHALPFPDASFDAAFCLEALEHVFDPAKVLREMKRVLKPGGYAVLLVPTDSLLFRTIWFAWTRLRGAIWDGTHIQSFKGHSLAQLSKESGFTVEMEKTFLLGMLVMVRLRKRVILAG